MRAKNSTEQRNEQQVYRTSKIVRVSCFCLVLFQLYHFRLPRSKIALAMNDIREDIYFKLIIIDELRFHRISRYIYIIINIIEMSHLSFYFNKTNCKINYFCTLIAFNILSITILYCPSHNRGKMRDKIGWNWLVYLYRCQYRCL